MQLSTGMPAIRRFLICAFLAVSSGCASAAEGGNDLETVVKNLYAQRKNDAPVQEFLKNISGQSSHARLFMIGSARKLPKKSVELILTFSLIPKTLITKPPLQ
jgi:hypothetical protein